MYKLLSMFCEVALKNDLYLLLYAASFIIILQYAIWYLIGCISSMLHVYDIKYQKVIIMLK